MSDLAKCRSCDAPIRWARSNATNRPMPLNREPHENGNVYIGLIGGEEVAIVLAGDELIQARVRNDPLYLNHFVNCPNAQEHRRRG